MLCSWVCLCLTLWGCRALSRRCHSWGCQLGSHTHSGTGGNKSGNNTVQNESEHRTHGHQPPTSLTVEHTVAPNTSLTLPHRGTQRPRAASTPNHSCHPVHDPPFQNSRAAMPGGVPLSAWICARRSSAAATVVIVYRIHSRKQTPMVPFHDRHSASCLQGPHVSSAAPADRKKRDQTVLTSMSMRPGRSLLGGYNKAGQGRRKCQRGIDG